MQNPMNTANTVEINPALASIDYCLPKYFEKEGWVLETVNLRGQGGIDQKCEQYHEREMEVKLTKGKTLALPLKERTYSFFRSITLDGKDVPKFNSWLKENLPFFSVSITTITLCHMDTGDRVTCRVIGRATKNPLSKKFIAHKFNGAKMTEDNVHEVASLLNGLTYAYCHYEYSAGKRNIICENEHYNET